MGLKLRNSFRSTVLAAEGREIMRFLKVSLFKELRF